ncbi:MAG: dihydrofolate reductase [Propionibacteriaceae bacterium]|jgi:dihydrofolate reductase|nr:dihydrofolate reductase [Propionibacteriaceae bacterium]
MTWTPALTAIAAVADNGVIGSGHGLLWRIPADFRRFKQVTWGGVLLMGRATFDSLGGPLPGRCSVVISRSLPPTDSLTTSPDTTVIVVASVAEALACLGRFPDRAWWSIGGGQIYRALWDYTTDLDLTEVHQSPAGPVTFPDINPEQWRELSRQPEDGFEFVTYTRRQADASERLAAAVDDKPLARPE